MSKTKVPMLNMAPAGFKPGFICSSFYLCPGNTEYWLADTLAPHCRACGISPNAITICNCLFVRIPSLYLLIHRHFILFIIALLLNQVLDCLDGQIARRFNCGTAFGAWLDHMTDSVYFVAICLLTLYISVQNLPVFFTIFIMSICVGVSGHAAMRVKEEGTHWTQLTSVETAGVVQEWFISYVYIAVYTCLAVTL